MQALDKLWIVLLGSSALGHKMNVIMNLVTLRRSEAERSGAEESLGGTNKRFFVAKFILSPAARDLAALETCRRAPQNDKQVNSYK